MEEEGDEEEVEKEEEDGDCGGFSVWRLRVQISSMDVLMSNLKKLRRLKADAAAALVAGAARRSLTKAR